MFPVKTELLNTPMKFSMLFRAPIALLTRSGEVAHALPSSDPQSVQTRSQNRLRVLLDPLRTAIDGADRVKDGHGV